MKTFWTHWRPSFKKETLCGRQ